MTTKFAHTSTKTLLAMNGQYLREYRENPTDAEIRELAGELLRQLRRIAPNTYQDIPDTPYSY